MLLGYVTFRSTISILAPLNKTYALPSRNSWLEPTQVTTKALILGKISLFLVPLGFWNPVPRHPLRESSSYPSWGLTPLTTDGHFPHPAGAPTHHTKLPNMKMTSLAFSFIGMPFLPHSGSYAPGLVTVLCRCPPYRIGHLCRATSTLGIIITREIL